MKMKPFWLLAWGSACLLASCTANSEEPKSSVAPKSVPVVALYQKDTTVFKEYIADVQAQKNIEIRSKLSGFLTKIHVDEGAFVRKGQLLFELQQEEFAAALAQAEAGLSSALAEVKKVEVELERTKNLLQQNIVSETEYHLLEVQSTAAQAKVEEAKALVTLAKVKLEQSNIRAPFDGKIDRILLKEGSLLSEGALITSLSDTEHAHVYFNISELEYLDWFSQKDSPSSPLQHEVQFVMANGQLFPHSGKASLAESEFNTQTGSISMRARFANPNGLLKHGATGRILVPHATGELLLVHQKSVLEIQDKAYVFVVQPDQQIKMTPFEQGARVGHYYIVESGLSAGTKVVYEGVQSLQNDMYITPKALTNY
jgi:RND family efflux transporter MFP subunit